MALVDKIIWQIETHLDDPLSLNTLADRCAVNVHHMARAFQLRTGHSVMGYTRARRLSKAARAIADGERDLIQVALTAGYGSHAAFTRAFSAAYGIAPSAVRSVGHLPDNMMEPFPMSQANPTQIAAPDIRERAAFRVVGFETLCKDRDISAIPGLWQQLGVRLADFGGPAPETYGVSTDATPEGDFRYMAGMECDTVPEGATTLTVPAGRYAVFTLTGHIADLPPLIAAIWDHGLNDLGLTPANAPEFERYDHRFDPIQGRGTLEIWIPVN